MRKILLYCVSFILIFDLSKSAQPNFPDQIVFGVNDGSTFYAVDQINQKAYFKAPYNVVFKTEQFLMKNFTYAPPDTPQANSYVFLTQVLEGFSCTYHTFSKHGINSSFYYFPSHWCKGIDCHIGNFIEYNYTMVHSKLSLAEDHWYSNETCQTSDGKTYPCQEIYFLKGTEVPLRYYRVESFSPTDINRVKTSFIVLSVGKSIDRYFETIPQQWPNKCNDDELKLLFEPNSIEVSINQSVPVQVWLSNCPHPIYGSSKVTVVWNATDYKDCFQWNPYELTFDNTNFDTKQTLVVTRLNNSGPTEFAAHVYGGGFDSGSDFTYTISVK